MVMVFADESSRAAPHKNFVKRPVQSGVLKPVSGAQGGRRHDALARGQRGAELTERKFQPEFRNRNP